MGISSSLQRYAQKKFSRPKGTSIRKRSADEATPLHPLLHLQQAVGNQAVLRLLQSGALQAKLKINQHADAYEQEADRVAERLMPKEEEEELIQIKPVSGQIGPTGAPEVSGGGQSLSKEVRNYFEPRYRCDFSHIRIHTDAQAAESARELSALAYTVGRDIFFGVGQYAPETIEGRRLFAHELTHVVQQASSGSDTAIELGGAPVGVQAKPDERGGEKPRQETGTKTSPEKTGGGTPSAASTAATVLDGFKLDKATLTNKHLMVIDQIAFQIWLHLSLNVNAKATLSITGHTDTTGKEKHNEGLGEKRANNAKDALEAALKKQQIESEKLAPATTKSFGETQLRVPTGDNVDEPRNRRVEIEVTIEVKPPPQPAPSAPKLPGTPGGPKIWEVPGIMEEFGPLPRGGSGLTQPIPSVPAPTREWLKEALERDPLLKKLPKEAREKAIDALKDADEKAADAIIDAIPFDAEYKKAAKAAVKALLQTIKGRRFKPPPSPSNVPEWKEMPTFPRMPGEMIFKLPPIKF